MDNAAVKRCLEECVEYGKGNAEEQSRIVFFDQLLAAPEKL